MTTFCDQWWSGHSSAQLFKVHKAVLTLLGHELESAKIAPMTCACIRLENGYGKVLTSVGCKVLANNPCSPFWYSWNTTSFQCNLLINGMLCSDTAPSTKTSPATAAATIKVLCFNSVRTTMEVPCRALTPWIWLFPSQHRQYRPLIRQEVVKSSNFWFTRYVF